MTLSLAFADPRDPAAAADAGAPTRRQADLPADGRRRGHGLLGRGRDRRPRRDPTSSGAGGRDGRGPRGSTGPCAAWPSKPVHRDLRPLRDRPARISAPRSASCSAAKPGARAMRLEAMQAVLAYAATPALRRLPAAHPPGNRRSDALLESSGFEGGRHAARSRPPRRRPPRLPAVRALLAHQSAPMIPRKSAAFSEAPPTSAPPTSGSCRISAALAGFTEPP